MNTALALDAGRQYPLVAMIDFTFANITDAGVAVPVIKLPRNARVLRGQIITSTGFTAATTIKVGTATDDDRYGTIDATAAGVDNLMIPTDTVDDTAIVLTPSATMAVGAATIWVEYVLANRSNEVQP